MPDFKIVFTLLLSLFIQTASAIGTPDLVPVEQAFKLSATATSRHSITLNWDILDGYYLYRSKLGFISQSDQVTLGAPQLPAGQKKHDEFFGEVETYRHKIQVNLPITADDSVSDLTLLVKHQGCADIGVCYPPQKTILDISLPPAPSSQAPEEGITQFLNGLGNAATGLFTDELLPPEEAFQFFAEVLDGHTLRASWLIADDYYLYREKAEFSIKNNAGTTLGSFTVPEGQPYHDEAFGQVQIFYQELAFDVPLIRTSKEPHNITLTAKYQGCADRGVCYPPMQSSVDLMLPAVATLASKNITPVSAGSARLSEQDQIVNTLKHDSLALTLLSFFGFGLLLAFTPCVFPMIPILSGIIVGTKNITTSKAFALSFSYVLASALTYTVFGILAALFGSNLQVIFQNPWIIGFFSAIFILLSLSMFGLFTLELPKSIQSYFHNSSDKHRDGSYVGAFIMGALSSLIVGPCVAAPLAAALIYIGQTGDVILGGSALFSMGMGMGFPLLLVGGSAGKLLPKTGNWLNSTKSVFGVIMLAVAVWMLSRILPATVTMLLWALLLIIPAIYMNAIDPLPQNASNWRKLWKGLGVVSLVYGILLLIGVGAGNDNPLQPLYGLSANAAGNKHQGIEFEHIKTVADLDQRIAQASAQQQFVMLDFYADWCISCKEMEAYTFTDPQVKQKLENFVLIQADVTANDAADKALLKRFNLIGPPGIIFFSPNQQEIAHARVIGFQDAATFNRTLQSL